MNDKKRSFELGKIACRVQWIKDNLHTRPTWTKKDYEEFYERDVRFLLKSIDLLCDSSEMKGNQAFEFLEEAIFGKGK